MRKINLNGVTIQVMLESEAKAHRILDECHYLDQNYVMYGPRTKGDIVKAAGFKQNFDYALPETWLDGLPSPEARDEALRWYVWSYDGIYSIFGHPVDLRTLLEQVKRYARKATIES